MDNDSHVVEIRAKVTNSKGVVTYEKNIDLREMNLSDVVKIQSGVSGLEKQIADSQLTGLK